MPSSVIAKRRFGPDTFVVASTATGAAQVVGGRLVKFHASEIGKIMLGANDDKWLGVALYDAHPGQTADGTSGSGYPSYEENLLPSEVAVAWTGEFVLTFTGTANPGDVVYAGANGTVTTTAGSATRPVGQVVQTSAVANNGTGLVRLFG